MDAPDHYQTTYDSKTKIVVFYSLNILNTLTFSHHINGCTSSRGRDGSDLMLPDIGEEDVLLVVVKVQRYGRLETRDWLERSGVIGLVQVETVYGVHGSKHQETVNICGVIMTNK